MLRLTLPLPGSLLARLLLGFALALLPLVAALAVATLSVEELTRRAADQLVRADAAARDGRGLVARLDALERTARQYRVLVTPELREAYERNRSGLFDALERLRTLGLDDSRDALLAALARDLTPLAAPPEGDDAALAERFRPLAEHAASFLERSNAAVADEVEHLRARADEVRSRTLWLALLAAVAAFAFAGLAAGLIARPLRQLAVAIRRLGNEDFATPVVVSGPRDLRALGTRLEWLRARLAELEQAKARFLRSMSHELKTPLTALREGSDLLAGEVLGPLNAEQREVATILTDNAQRLQRRIEDLLNFNRLLARSLSADKVPVELQELVGQVVAAHRLACQARQLEVAVAVPVLHLAADRDKLATVLDNLLGNAVKFSPAGGRIDVRASATGGALLLEVEDQGPGFGPDEHERVFEAFYQGGAPVSGPVQGSGLGLAIAREFALLHGGALAVVAGQGPGGCVRLTLPLA